jgi:N-methylhydantoinase A
VTALTDAEVERVVAAVRAGDPTRSRSACCSASSSPTTRSGSRTRSDLGVPVTRASALLPVLREVERTSTVLNAYVASAHDPLPRLAGGTGWPRRPAPPVEVMRSGGGTFAAGGRPEPVHTLLSGPAAGAWGARRSGGPAASPT